MADYGGYTPTVLLYLSDRFASSHWGVHVRAGSDPLQSLCCVSFDDNGKSLHFGFSHINEVITHAHGETVTCPECINVLDELKR